MKVPARGGWAKVNCNRDFVWDVRRRAAACPRQLVHYFPGNICVAEYMGGDISKDISQKDDIAYKEARDTSTLL